MPLMNGKLIYGKIFLCITRSLKSFSVLFQLGSNHIQENVSYCFSVYTGNIMYSFNRKLMKQQSFYPCGSPLSYTRHMVLQRNSFSMFSPAAFVAISMTEKANILIYSCPYKCIAIYICLLHRKYVFSH